MKSKTFFQTICIVAISMLFVISCNRDDHISLTKEEINFLCDAGFYNDAIKGYLITAAKNAGLDREQIKKLLDGLYWAFDEKDKVDAEEIYKNF